MSGNINNEGVTIKVSNCVDVVVTNDYFWIQQRGMKGGLQYYRILGNPPNEPPTPITSGGKG